MVDYLDPDVSAAAWTWSGLERVAIAVCWRARDRRQVLGDIARMRREWTTLGHPGVPSAWVSGTLRTALLARLASRYEALGDVAGRLGSSDILDSAPPVPPGLISPDVWVAPYLAPDDGIPIDAVVTGERGHGKSSLACLIASRLAAAGWLVLTTVPLVGRPPDRVVQVASVRRVVEALDSAWRTGPCRTVLILDEAAIASATGRQYQQTRDAREWRAWVILARKLGLSHVYLSTRADTIAGPLLDEAALSIRVERRGDDRIGTVTVRADRWPRLALRGLRVAGVPPSPIPYDSDGVAVWSLDGLDRVRRAVEDAGAGSYRDAIRAAAAAYPRDAPTDTTCGDCGLRCSSPRGLQQHVGRAHAPERAARKRSPRSDARAQRVTKKGP